MKTTPFLNDDDFFKSTTIDEAGNLIKAKKYPVGTIRTWKGKKFQKQANGKWASVKKLQMQKQLEKETIASDIKEGKLKEHKSKKLKYAEYFLMHNPIKKDEVDYYSGKTNKKPHGIDNEIWKQAWKNVKNKINIKQ